MDCHTEANVNWLPPLIEPIAKNYRTCVCPFVDVIDAKTYQYRTMGSGTRGVFNWDFYYQFLPLRPGDQLSEDDPVKTVRSLIYSCWFDLDSILISPSWWDVCLPFQRNSFGSWEDMTQVNTQNSDSILIMNLKFGLISYQDLTFGVENKLGMIFLSIQSLK